MNERINEIARQAGIHFGRIAILDCDAKGVAKYVSYSKFERFAELLVKESIVVGSQAWLADSSVVPVFPAKKIKEHFGVEL
jgi:hypothetical protein